MSEYDGAWDVMRVVVLVVAGAVITAVLAVATLWHVLS